MIIEFTTKKFFSDAPELLTTDGRRYVNTHKLGLWNNRYSIMQIPVLIYQEVNRQSDDYQDKLLLTYPALREFHDNSFHRGDLESELSGEYQYRWLEHSEHLEPDQTKAISLLRKYIKK